MSASGSSDRQGPRRTLRGRVSLLGTAVIGLWVVLVTAVFNIVLTGRLDHQGDVLVRTRADAAAATVDVSGGAVTVRESSGDSQLDSGIWVYAHGRVVTKPSGGDRGLDRLTAVLSSGPAGYRSRGSDRFYVRGVRHDGRVVATVVALLSDTPYERAEQEALIGSSLVALLVIAGSYPVLRLASGRALRPVTGMARQAGEWSVHGLDERFGDRHRYQEVRSLATTLDSVLDTLSAIVRHERQLSAELSHELRTPLSRIVAETDLMIARRRTVDELVAGHVAVRDGALAMERLIETLLTTAREEVRTAPGRSDVDTVLQAMTAGREASVEVDVEPGLVVGVDATVLERILAPVLDNALRHAAREVRMTAGRADHAVVVDVVDDGPGVPDEQRAAVFEPGFRGTPDDGHDGAGLGLALSRRLARAASGEVELVGGSVFRIRLPPA